MISGIYLSPHKDFSSIYFEKSLGIFSLDMPPCFPVSKGKNRRKGEEKTKSLSDARLRQHVFLTIFLIKRYKKESEKYFFYASPVYTLHSEICRPDSIIVKLERGVRDMDA